MKRGCSLPLLGGGGPAFEARLKALDARANRAGTYYPQTIFFSRQGTVVYDHIGEYPTTAALVQDVRRYALR